MIKVIDVKREQFAFKLEVESETWTGKHFQNLIAGDHLYEPESTLIVQALKPGDRFLDIGAHVGWYSMLAASLCDGKVNVESFEPNVTNFLRLLRNIELNDRHNIVPHCMAMSGKRGIANLYLNSDNDGGHALWPVEEHPQAEKTKEQKPGHQLAYTTTIDRWVNRMTGRLWVKIDAEGAEQAIVEKFPFDIGLSKAPVFICEINHTCLERVGSSEKKLRQCFADHGCHAFAFSDLKLVRLGMESTIKTDYVFNLVFCQDASFPETF